MSRLRKRKIEHQLNLGIVFWLIGFAALLCGSGVAVCLIKNKQINLQRDMQRMLVEINSCEKTEEYYKHKINSETSRWAIQDRLVQNQSELIGVDSENVWYISLGQEGEVAANVNK